jgi:hypothetical protein
VNLIANNTAAAASRHNPHQACGTAAKTTAHDIYHVKARCPAECPLFVDDTTTATNCDFACVPDSIQNCKERSPMTPVADPVTGECRRCCVTGCSKCLLDGTERCVQCFEGYQLKANGRCGYTWGYFAGYCAVILLLVVIVVVVVLVVGWISDLCLREVSNPDGRRQALQVRSRTKIHMPKTPGEPRSLWPLNTNLCRQDVAGPAVVLLFNFQAAVVLWAVVLAITRRWLRPTLTRIFWSWATRRRRRTVNIASSSSGATRRRTG